MTRMELLRRFVMDAPKDANTFLRKSGNSPSTMSFLRQYRFQRKPNDQGSSAPSVVQSGPSNSQTVRMPAPNVSTVRNSVPIMYKRIRLQDSDSDDNPSPVKRPALPSTNMVGQKIATMQPEITTAMKEKRFRNMLEMFPDIAPMQIKNTLAKHGWNEERTRDELLRYDPETEDIKSSTSKFFGSRPGASGVMRSNGISMQGLQGAMRVSSGQTHTHINVVRKPLAAKGLRARRGSSGSEDDDYGVRKGKDDKVYDSEDSDNEISNDLIGDKKKVFDFLNSSNMHELSMLSGCSQKKAEAIASQRPFKSWLDMVEKFNNCKGLSTDLLNATQELLSRRNSVQDLMKRCERLANNLQDAVAAGAGRLQQPSILEPSLKLAPYQLVGLNWLAVLHKQGVNGILADEMGLGKTVQVIAFLAYLKETGQSRGSHLIVVPASTLDNWCVELARWCPSMRVSRYYGNPEERRQLRIDYGRNISKYDIVLTTYTMVHSCPEERKMFRITPMHYVVYDEAHMLKNMATQRYDNLLKIKSKHRLLLTGTPLQNNLLELMSLLCFVMPDMFHGKSEGFKSLFQKNAKYKGTKKGEDDEDDVPAFEKTQITQAKRIMKPFVLRRLKKDVLQDLPKKTNYTEYCTMAQRQQKLYKELCAGFAARNNDGTIHATTEQSGISMMMDMRKLANHPLLLRYYYEADVVRQIAKRLAKDPSYKEKNEQYAFEDLMCLSDFQIHQLTLQHSCISQYKVPDKLILESGKFEKLDEMLPRLKAEGHRVLVFSQFTMMLDVLEPYLALRDYRYLRLDGSTAVGDRHDLIEQYNAEDIFVFLLSTRAGGLGINLTAADTVIIHDMDFNPYNDKQAEDRCHRMGQTREVTIYRLISSGTIEEGIYQVAQEKLNLEKHVTDADENEPTEHKNVVRLLSAALGLTSPNK